MSEWDVQALAGWVVAIRARCPECGEVHEVLLLACELVGCGIDDEGVFYGRTGFTCDRCYLGR